MSFLFFEIPVFILISGKGRNQFLISLTVFLAVLIAAIIIRKKKQLDPTFKISYPLTSIVLSLILAVFFFRRWHMSGRIITIANYIEKPLQQTAVLTALLIAFLSLPGIDLLIQIFAPPAFIKTSQKLHKNKELFIILFLILTAFLTMFLNSKCSPLYPLNDWVDPNTMFTVGKGVLKGYVPYRDLYDQKGPLLYFVQTLGAAVSYDTFLGIWFIELIACFFFLYYSLKIASLFFGKKMFVCIPFLAAVIYSPYAFRTGDTAEEFALPLLSYALYIGFRCLKNKTLPSSKEFFLIGITSGAVFWMKYSMLGFYIGWFIMLLLETLRDHKTTILIKGCGLILCGVILWAVPIFIYFGVNHSVYYMLQGYFTDNFKYYTQDYTILKRMEIGLWSLNVYFIVPMIIAGIGLAWMILRKKWKNMILTLFSAVFSFFVIYYASVRGPYYCLPLGVFTILGFCALADALKLIPKIKGLLCCNILTFSAETLLTGMLILCFFSDNLKFLEYPREEMFQFQMKDIIEKSGIESPTILYDNIGDAGVNTVAGLLPDIRFFVNYNFNERPDIIEAKQLYLTKQVPDFIIARTKFENDYPLFETYEYQGSITGMADQIMQYFHYYTRKDLSHK